MGIRAHVTVRFRDQISGRNRVAKEQSDVRFLLLVRLVRLLISTFIIAFYSYFLKPFTIIKAFEGVVKL